jgi:hypothetical protein
MLKIAFDEAGGGVSRRHFLSAGFLGLGSLTLADLFASRAAASTPTNDKSIILLWVGGGPSHLETYDLKPNAPSTVRSLFAPIRTRVPGMDVCELLPKHAAIADKFTLFRSLAHNEFDHGFGTRRFLTGYRDDLTRGENRRPFYPSVDCGVYRTLGTSPEGLPSSILVGQQEYGGPGFWGGRYEVPRAELRHDIGRFGECGGLPGLNRVAVPEDRLRGRRELLSQLNRFRAQVHDSRVMDGVDANQRRAFEILASPKVREAFDLTREADSVRAKFGQGCQHALLARRLVEAGVRLVQVSVGGKPPTPRWRGVKEWFNWDDHAVNWSLPEGMQIRLPWYDHLVTTLIDDLYQRGLDEKVLLIVTGEFGRSPRLEFNNGRYGRDHWCPAMSILVSGGGRQRGNVVGATDPHGGRPVTKQYDPHDMLASIYDYLGIDPEMVYLDPVNRPVPLSRGTPIREVI